MTDFRLYLAVVHHPVYNKHHEIVTTSIVIHDIHDIARAGKT
ncbi:RNA methyltransferase, partial [Candidatus Cryosericum odellii]